jgi:hypothetical protein
VRSRASFHGESRSMGCSVGSSFNDAKR